MSPLIFLGHSGKCFFTTPLLHWRKCLSFAGGTEFLPTCCQPQGKRKISVFWEQWVWGRVRSPPPAPPEGRLACMPHPSVVTFYPLRLASPLCHRSDLIVPRLFGSGKLCVDKLKGQLTHRVSHLVCVDGVLAREYL